MNLKSIQSPATILIDIYNWTEAVPNYRICFFVYLRPTITREIYQFLHIEKFILVKEYLMI